MNTSLRAIQLRNGLVSISNGAITLVILLIAPLGLAAVIVNTLLVAVATYAVSSVGDRIVAWLLPSGEKGLFSSQLRQRRSIRVIDDER
jgi:hypothetical protein